MGEVGEVGRRIVTVGKCRRALVDPMLEVAWRPERKRRRDRSCMPVVSRVLGHADVLDEMDDLAEGPEGRRHRRLSVAWRAGGQAIEEITVGFAPGEVLAADLVGILQRPLEGSASNAHRTAAEVAREASVVDGIVKMMTIPKGIQRNEIVVVFTDAARCQPIFRGERFTLS